MSRDRFLKSLRKGYRLELEVAKQFLMEGYVVQMEPYQEDRADKYDIRVKATSRKRWVTLEIKGSTRAFTGLSDHPYDDIFVETKGRWERRGNPPDYWLATSYDTADSICLSKDTRKHWEEVTTMDRSKGFTDTFLTCPKKYWISWDDLLGNLKV